MARQVWNKQHLETRLPDTRGPVAACNGFRRMHLTTDPARVECLGCESIVLRIRDSLQILGLALHTRTEAR